MSARVIYSFTVSLDGYINDANGALDWGGIDDETHGWFNDRARESAAFLYGRRLYETMAPYWPNALEDNTISEVELDFARIWVDKPKVVFSHTLERVGWNSRLTDQDIVDALPALKDEFDGDLDVGGAHLASRLIARNLVDEYRLIVAPVAIGGGTPFFPPGVRLDLELVETSRFTNGSVLLIYRPRH